MRKLISLAITTILLTGAAGAEPAQAAKTDVVQHVNATEAAKLLSAPGKKPKPVILDIRTPGEFAGGHLEGAVNIDFKDKEFAANLAKLDKKKPYVVY